MIILGIDPGTARMGFGVVESKRGGKLKLLDCGVWLTYPTLEPEKRLKFLFQNLNSILKEHNPDVMVLEKLFFNTNAKTAIAVGQARGICMLAAANKKVKVHDYTALQAKLVLTGYGRSDKKVMQEAVRKIFKNKLQIKSDDANDAVAMALCYVKKNFGKDDVKKVMKVDSVKKIKTKKLVTSGGLPQKNENKPKH